MRACHSEFDDDLDVLRGPRSSDLNAAVLSRSRSIVPWSQLAAEVERRTPEFRALEGPLALEAGASLDTLLWIGAALASRRPLLLLHPSFPSELQAELAAAAGAVGRVHASGIRSLNHERVTLDPRAQFLIPTSGSSGRPKLVQLSRENLLAAVRASRRHLPLQASDRLLLSLPLAHVGGLSVFLRALSVGAAVVLERVDWSDAAELVALRHLGVTHASVVPTQLSDLLTNPALSGLSKTLRVLLVGGAPTPPALRVSARRAGIPALYTYGMTETCAQVCTQDPAELLAPGSESEDVGRPLEGTQIEVREGGDLWVRGPQLMLGYVGEAPISRNWWQTGDRGHWDARGRLVVVGRTDSTLITGGEKVSPEWLESRLLPLPGVQRLAITGVEDPRWGQRVVACVVWASPLATGSSRGVVERDQARAFEQACRERIPKFAHPKEWLAFSKLPLLANGKLDRRELKRWAQLQLATAPGERR